MKRNVSGKLALSVFPLHHTMYGFNLLFYRRYTNAALQIESLKRSAGSVSPAAVGRALYAAALRTLETEESVKATSRLMPSLLQAGCLGDNRALHLASVLYSSGLGVKKQPYKVCSFRCGK